MPRPARPRPGGRRWLACGLVAMAGFGRAEVPAEQAVGLYAATDPRHREWSPIWGMVALKSGILANIRFYGGYGATERDGLPRHPQLKRSDQDHPQDAIAAVVQYLFPSPDGLNLIHNEYTKDPIGGIAAEARERRRGGKHPPAAPGLRRIGDLLEAIGAYRAKLRPTAGAEAKAAPAASLETKAGDPATPDGAAPDAAARAFQETVARILGPVRAPAAGAAGAAQARVGETKGGRLDQLRGQFAALLQRAVVEETQDRDQRYPPDVVEVALLAYAWCAADQVEELHQAFDGTLLVPASGEGSRAPFNRDYYGAHREGFLRRLEERANGLASSDPAPSPEEIALFLQGYRAFDAPVGDLVSHRTTTFKKPDAPESTRVPYPDCGETSLRNFFNLVLTNAGDLDPDRLKQFLGKFQDGKAEETKGPATPIHPGRLKAIAAYFTHQHQLATQSSDQAHLAWSDLVSDLNRPGDPIPITYRDGDHNLQGIGLWNMLNLIGHLLPDPVLNTPWPSSPVARHRLEGDKLTRLCQIASSTDRTFDWTFKGGKSLDTDLPEVLFTLNGEPAFTWAFDAGHFAILAVPGQGLKDLAGLVARVTKDPWLALWVRPYDARVPRVANNRYRPQALAKACEIFGYQLANADERLRVMESILGSPCLPALANYERMGSRLPFDGHALEALGRMISRYPAVGKDPAHYPLPWLLARPKADKDHLLARLWTVDEEPQSLALLLDHGADANLEHKGEPILARCIKDGYGTSALALLRAGARPEARDPGGRTALAVAADYGRPSLAQALIEAKVDLEAKDRAGLTPLALAARDGHWETLGVLLAAGAKLEAQAPDGSTPLLLAAANPYTDVAVLALLDAGASVDARNQAGETPLLAAVSVKYSEQVVRTLLDAGADVEAKDGQGRSVLERALANPRSKAFELVRARLEERAAGAEAKTAGTAGAR